MDIPRRWFAGQWQLDQCNLRFHFCSVSGTGYVNMARSWNDFADWLCTSWLRDERLVGKAAFERILDVVFTASLCRIFQHTLMEFDAKFISNILAENSQAGDVPLIVTEYCWCTWSRHAIVAFMWKTCISWTASSVDWWISEDQIRPPHDSQDSGNKVIQQFVKRVLARSFHPMVDVMSLLVWKHLEICFTLAQKPISPDSSSLKEPGSTQLKFLAFCWYTRIGLLRSGQEIGLQAHFDSSAELYAHTLVKRMNQDFPFFALRVLDFVPLFGRFALDQSASILLFLGPPRETGREWRASPSQRQTWKEQRIHCQQLLWQHLWWRWCRGSHKVQRALDE